jgi:rhodanese-related sulfurtransferase
MQRYAYVINKEQMKFILDNWMLISVALASGALLFWPVLQGAATTGIDTSAVVQLINREKAVVVDVCKPAEFAAGHVGGAKNIPQADLEAKLTATVKNKAVPLILVCQSGTRSARAVAVAKKLGYERAQSMAGGLAAWKMANLPLEKS